MKRTTKRILKYVKRYFRNILVWLDQGLNVIFLFGDEDETVSSRAGKAARKGKTWGCVLCKVLDWFDPDHCEKSIERSEGRRNVFRRRKQIN